MPSAIAAWVRFCLYSSRTRAISVRSAARQIAHKRLEPSFISREVLSPISIGLPSLRGARPRTRASATRICAVSGQSGGRRSDLSDREREKTRAVSETSGFSVSYEVARVSRAGPDLTNPESHHVRHRWGQDRSHRADGMGFRAVPGVDAELAAVGVRAHQTDAVGAVMRARAEITRVSAADRRLAGREH